MQLWPRVFRACVDYTKRKTVRPGYLRPTLLPRKVAAGTVLNLAFVNLDRFRVRFARLVPAGPIRESQDAFHMAH